MIRKIVDSIETTGSVDHAFLEREGVTLVEVHPNHLAGDWFGTWSNFYERIPAPGSFLQIVPPSDWFCDCHQHSMPHFELPDPIRFGNRAQPTPTPAVHDGEPLSERAGVASWYRSGDERSNRHHPARRVHRHADRRSRGEPPGGRRPERHRRHGHGDSATFVGPKITAAAPDGVAAADWPLVRADGTIVLDVRANMRTDDGADIFVTYNGIGVPREVAATTSAPLPCSRPATSATPGSTTCKESASAGTIDSGVEYQIYALK